MAINVFVSYSHTENDAQICDSLLGYLKGLEKDKEHKAKFWCDPEINPGDDWHSTIKKHVKKTDIALLLVSQSFLDSEYIQQEELSWFLKRRKKGLILMPIILSDCEIERHDWLQELQRIPTGHENIAEHYTNHGAQQALYKEIRNGLRIKIDEAKEIRRKKRVRRLAVVPIFLAVLFIAVVLANQFGGSLIATLMDGSTPFSSQASSKEASTMAPLPLQSAPQRADTPAPSPSLNRDDGVALQQDALLRVIITANLDETHPPGSEPLTELAALTDKITVHSVVWMDTPMPENKRYIAEWRHIPEGREAAPTQGDQLDGYWDEEYGYRYRFYVDNGTKWYLDKSIWESGQYYFLVYAAEKPGKPVGMASLKIQGESSSISNHTGVGP